MNARAFALVLGAVLLGILATSAGWITQRLTESPPPVRIAATEFTLVDLDGKTHRLSDYHGEVVLLNFWATWCAPCVKEMPLLVEFQNRYRESGLQVLGLTLDKPASAREFAARLKINYPLLGDQRSVIAVQDAYGENRLPFTVLIDRNGNAVWQHAGEITAQLLEPALFEVLQ